MFIVLEGADGTGKSTLCSVLSKKLGATPYACPPKKYQELRTSIDRNVSAEEHYRFYLNGNYDASKEIAELLKKGEKVVCDRYWLSTYTYHQIMGVPVSRSDFQSIIFPTLTVLLAVKHEVQIARMFHRGMSVGDIRALEKQREIADMYYRNVLEFNIPFLFLDTQRFSPEACAEIVARTLES